MSSYNPLINFSVDATAAQLVPLLRERINAHDSMSREIVDAVMVDDPEWESLYEMRRRLYLHNEETISLLRQYAY
jgi:hypothetical protein